MHGDDVDGVEMVTVVESSGYVVWMWMGWCAVAAGVVVGDWPDPVGGAGLLREEGGDLVRSYLVQDSLDYKRSLRIQQYLQHEHYDLWEVIEFGDSYKAPPKEIAKDKGLAGEVSASTKKKGRTVAITAEDMQKRKNDVKARTTLLLALPDEHQLRFSKYDSTKELWEAILKTFGRNEATKKTKKNQLKQQYAKWIQIKYKDISQIDDDDIEEMDIKLNLALLSMKADRSPRSQDRWKRKSYKKDPKVEEPAPKAMIAIDGIGWDWSYMAEENEASKNHSLMADDEEEVPTEYALMAKSSSSSDNEVYDDSFCSKSCRKNTENLNTKISKPNEELSDCETDLYNYKRGLSQVEARFVKFKENEIKFCEKIRVLERDIELKDNKIEYLRNELEEVKKEKESLDLKIEKFENASNDLDRLLGSQKLDKDKKGVGFNEYRVVPPPHAQVYSPPKKDLSWMGLHEFVDDTVTDYTRPKPSIDVSKSGIPQDNIDDKGYWDSSCSRHMTGNISYISEYEPFNGGYVAFGHGRGKITVDFLEASHIRYALMVHPTVYVSHIRQFWSTARVETMDGETKILAKVNGRQRTVSESLIRRHLKLNDEEGISTLPDNKLFENLSLMGYNILPNQRFSFQKGQFSHQWKFLIHTIMQCLSPKSISFNEFSSNIATALVCLATNKTYHFSKMLIDGMIRNIKSKGKFLMYPRENIAKTSAMSHEASPMVTSLSGGKGREDLLVGDTVKDSDKSADKGSDSTNDMANVLGATNILASGG
uniref:Synaptobrevin, longin-like domain protein n=1 Tax=Tanacetum cinerariifolium TaxID=118510 RepID=A0A699HNC5_TANCI|nr:synaptobrevin, longin-like domain protein [Tanacetum cinerariifolium]